MQVEARFEWERIMPRNEWEQLIRALPSTSPLFTHSQCSSRRCRRRDGSQLHASTIKHIALTLATFARPDGSRAFPGLARLQLGTARSKITVVAGLRHLETVGLVLVQVRANTIGVSREHATVYCLATPPIETLAGLAGTEEQAQVYGWFSREHPHATG